MQESLPNSVTSFEKKHPAVWEVFAKIGEACHETGLLDEKTRRLVKLALAIAFRSAGAVHSATPECITIVRHQGGYRTRRHPWRSPRLDWPAAHAATTWIEATFRNDRLHAERQL